MDVTVRELQSTVRAADGRALASAPVLEAIVEAVLLRLEERDRRQREAARERTLLPEEWPR